MKKEVVRKFISYYRPYRTTFFWDMTCAFLFAVCGLAYPILTRLILNTYIPQGQAATRAIVLLCAALLGIYLIRAAMNYYISFYGHRMGLKMQADMRSDLFRHLESLPYAFYDNNETGQLMSRMTNDLFNVSELAHHGPENLFITTFMTLSSFVYLCTINWKLALIIIASLPLMMLLTVRTRRRQRDAFALSKQRVGDINATVESSLAGIRVTKAYDNADYEQERFEVGNRAFVTARGEAYRAMAGFHTSMGFMTGFYNVLILVAGTLFLLYDAAHFDYADLVAFMLSVNLFVSPINTLVSFVEQLEDGATGFQRFYDILAEAPEPDTPDAMDPERIEGDIVFDHVSFSYNEDIPVLEDICLHVPKGQTYALVGTSGGGKTTLCHLVPKFYPLDHGDIRLDGHSIHALSNRCVRRAVGIVQQDVFLFAGSFRQNIAYGRPDCTQEEIEQAAKRAHIHDYIMGLPQGYDTSVGERGIKLSGGQKQRIAIARVFLKDPAILLLDEATSALDNTTETMIQQSLNELCVGRTTLVVAHRLSTIRDADCIVVIEQGRIAEQGTHEQLMMRQGIYYSLQQAGEGAQ